MSLGAIPTAGQTGISNLIFIVYEQIGFAGLGPGRLDLRQGNLKSFLPYAPVLGVSSIAFLAVASEAVRFLSARWKRGSLALSIAVLIVLPSASALLAAWAGHARLWGRHFTPVFPFVLFGLAIGVDQWSRKKTPGAKIVISVFLIALLTLFA